jgi:flagellar biosynthesis/type III secretory pathway M-ring protein FliF/YscJ
MEPLNRLVTQLHDLYRSMTPGSRLTMALAALAVLLGLGYMSTRPPAAADIDLMRGVPIAVTRLPYMEAAFAKANLAGYEVRGTSIFVPHGQESAYMAALVAAGALPPTAGSVGNAVDASDNPFIGKDQRELRMKNAKQTELALAISAMPGIEWASVFYDVDKSDPFKEKTITALVNVKPIEAQQLDEARVSSIRHQVAAAIAGLKPENVAVSDLNGRTWHGAINETVAAPTTQPLLRQTGDPRHKPTIAIHAPVAASDVGQEPLEWARQSWRTLAWLGLALLALVVLRSVLRARPTQVKTQLELPPNRGNRAGDTQESTIPAPHWRRKPESDDDSALRRELSQLVDEDPETAANILRTWIGQAS